MNGLETQKELGCRKKLEDQLLDIKTQIDDINQKDKISEPEKATRFYDMLTDIKEGIKIISQLSKDSDTKLSNSKVGKIREIFKSLKSYNETNNVLDGDDLEVVKVLAKSSKSTVSSLISKFHNYIGTLLNKLDSNLDPHSRLNGDQILDDKPNEYNFDDKKISSTTDQTESETNEDVSCKSSETENEINTESETSEESISEADIDKNEESENSEITN